MAHITTLTRAHTDIYNSNANTYSYSGSFETFKETEVIVKLDGVALTYQSGTINESASPRQYTVNLTDKTIHIGGGNLSSGTISIYPETDLGDPTLKAPYTAGSAITASDLTNNQKQVMRKAMELDGNKLSSQGGTMTGHLTMGEDQTIIFEGATDDGFETTLTVADPSGSDKTITLPNTTGTVITTGDTGTVAHAMLAGDAVDGDNIADNSVNTEHIVNSSITTAKLGTVNIADLSDVHTASPSDGQVLKWVNANSRWEPLAESGGGGGGGGVSDGDKGDITVSVSGAVWTIDDNAVSTVKIADEAVTLAKLPHGTSSNNGKFLRANNGADPTFETVDLSSAFDKGGGDTITGDFTIASGVTNKNIHIDVNGTSTLIRFDDDLKATFGDSDDLKIYHDGTDSVIHSTTGKLIIDTPLDSSETIHIRGNSGEESIVVTGNSSVDLYYDNVKKFETTSAGGTVTGTLTATAFAGDGSALTGIAAGPTGGGSDEIFWENGQTVTTNYTITNNKNAMSAGPITINNGIAVTIGTGENWTIV